MSLPKTLEMCDQKRSERIKVLPYSSIALTRSCFTEFFFIAIPPKKFGGLAAIEFSSPQSCSRSNCQLRLRCGYYSILCPRKKVG